MTDFQISCVKKDSNGVIYQVGIVDRGVYPIMSVVNLIHENPQDMVYTVKYGKPAKVFVRQHHLSKRFFLTTDPDDIRENNLDFLPKCA